MAQLPLARQTGLIIEEIPGELLIYDSDRDSALCLNHTAASVWRHCDGKTNPERIARLIEAELNIKEGAEVVALALNRLQECHLLAGAMPLHLPRVSRREAIGKIGIAAAIPVISMILVPTARAGAASCTPNQGSCMENVTCCSGCCIKGTCAPGNFCKEF